MHSADGHAHISTGVKKHFMFLEELNRTICENGLNFRLHCIYFFKNISQLPGHLIKHLLSFWISRIYLTTLTTFSGILNPSYVLPSCNTCCLPFPDKNKRKKQCFDSTLSKHAYKAFEWEAKTVWAMRGSHLTQAIFRICTALIVPWQ